VNINNLSNAFNYDLTRNFKGHTFDKTRILNDYILLTFLVGNDFVLSMPFLKIRKEGLKTLIAIYHNIKLKHNGYLVDYNPDENKEPSLNINFFKELIYEISLKEDFFMKEQQNEINKLMRGNRNPRDIEKESKSTPYEIYETRFDHLQVCSPDHPLFHKYHEDFKKINYKEDFDIWSSQYYKFYLNIDKSDSKEYLEVRMKLVENYLESIMFTLKYYFQGCPSWHWHYRYRISPLIHDIYYALENNIIDMNNISFEVGKPYTPFQQLMLILPPQMNELVPSVLRPIMSDDKLLCTQFYPIDFKMDVTVGIKTMYSEAILPEIDETLLINTVEKYEKKLNEEEKRRNTISTKPLMDRKKK
jgi:5'-3' exonuclease